MLQSSHPLPLSYPSISSRQPKAKVQAQLHQHSSTVKCGGTAKPSESNSAQTTHSGAAHILLLAKYKI